MLENTQNIFLLGIKGVAMANLALILKKMGKNVTGSDISEEFITDEWLQKNNIKVIIGFEANKLPENTELIIYSAAHQGEENLQVIEAKKRGIKVYHQAQFLGELMKHFKTKIAVCGSHGKTTTTAYLAYALIKLGVKPTYLVGSSSFNDYPGGDYLGDEYFVVEADEYGVNPPKDKTIKFHFLNPDIIVCTNIDFDHPDVFKDLDHAKAEFEKFFKKAKKVIYCPDGNDLSHTGCVTKTLLELGFKDEEIKEAMQGFTGVKRRFEEKVFKNNIYLFDDYAHHPKEIEATVQYARKKFENRRIIVLFQSHTYSRTKALLEDFGRSLALADYSLVGPIFPSARENPEEFNISAQDIAKASHSSNVLGFSSMDELLIKLEEIAKPGDVIFTMGAGDIYKLEADIMRIIENFK